MMKKLLKGSLALLLMLFTFSNTLSAQTQVPIDVVLLNAAPNLAWIQRTDASINVFKGDKFNYSLEVNNAKLKTWLNAYPQEFLAYQKAMDAFFATKNLGDFTSTDQDFYYDMKAQYQMLKILKPW